MEKGRDLGVHILNRLLFTLIRLQNFQELFIDFWFVLKAVLPYMLEQQSSTASEL